MLFLAHNCVIRIDDPRLEGVFRVLANKGEHREIVMTKIESAKPATDPRNTTTPLQEASPARNTGAVNRSLKFVDRDVLAYLSETSQLQVVKVEKDRRTLLAITGEGLSAADAAVFEKRKTLMEPFLDPLRLSEALYEARGIGRLVAEVMTQNKCTRAPIYRHWKLLCLYGLEAESLVPRHDRCGAPGVLRPVTQKRGKAGRKTTAARLGINETNPQPGYSEVWRAKVLAADDKIPTPKPRFTQRYAKIINTFATDYVHSEKGLVPVLPPMGLYPNRAQVRYMLKSIPVLKRLREMTTTGHFNRNRRGLGGKSWEGVAGPGHTYAIDSTIGDVHLRSCVNRAWIIGRPIVYIVVDVWSTAIVGFYVCLTGPSWDTAKVALFSTFADPEVVGSLWGYDALLRSLYPLPGSPFIFLCDRGEYLSMGARGTGGSLGINFDYAASYRPDWKGVVEVLHRIAKDTQYFFVPGAIDARRKELELRPDAKKSAFTLREYVQYLAWVFGLHNLTADRRNRFDGSMIAAGAEPTPAGLWRYGFEAGIGCRKDHTNDKLIATLLPQAAGSVLHRGILFRQNEYECELARQEQWTTLARHQGAIELPMHYFPGSMKNVWTPHPHGTGMLEFGIKDQARASGTMSHDEWLDTQVIAKLQERGREHGALERQLQGLNAIASLTESAKEATRRADAAHEGPLPLVREARSIESGILSEASGQADLQAPKPVDSGSAQELAELRNRQYTGLMNRVMGEVEKK